jgi:tRNA-specific 2-thiouridylase
MNKKKIMIGLSGGVDSAVTASILKSQGHDLEGVFMRNWDDDDSACQATTDLHDVEKLCDQLAIPLHTVNFSKDYMDRVFAIMLEELKQGLTPNPDILCNQEIKFDVLLKYVHKHAAQMLATGHYARITRHHGAPALTRSVDDNKDQTYFLCRMPQEALRHVLFPIGIYDKPTIRDMAQKIHIPQANKPDSTGICFIGERKFRDFISQYLLDVPGDIVDTHGERIGRHKGLFFYTIGQRKGLSIGGRKHCAEQPWFVVEKHMQENRLVVAQGDAHPSLYGDRLKAKSIHWLVDPDTLSQQMHVQAQIRHRQPLQAATVEWSSDELIATFEQPQRAITPGQSIAIYQNEICCGSAIISGSTS